MIKLFSVAAPLSLNAEKEFSVISAARELADFQADQPINRWLILFPHSRGREGTLDF